MPFKVKSLGNQNADTTYTGSWSGLSVGTEVQLEDASNIIAGNGNFGDKISSPGEGYPLADGTGSSANILVEGTDYNNDEYLDSTSGGVDIYDDGASGAFSLNKIVRIVENGKNITDGTGLGLRVKAKDLTYGGTPPKTECWVDPALGKFILPRPIHFNKCETLDIANVEIGNAAGMYEYSAGTTGLLLNTAEAKFGTHSYHFYVGTSTIRDVRIYPFGKSYRAPDQFTYSAWAYVRSGGTYRPRFTLGFNGSDLWYTRGDTTSRINIMGATDAEDGTDIPSIAWMHLYVIVDKTGTQLGTAGNTVEMYLDGALFLSTNSTLTNYDSIDDFWYGMQDPTANYDPSMVLDNVKVWDHIVATDPAWEYNSGSGRENAMHTIYGSGNDYTPVLSTTGGVGYYYKPAGSVVVLDEADAGGKLSWSI